MEFAAKIPTVTKCCCYFELRTGGIVLGWINVVWYGLVVLGSFGSLITRTPPVDDKQYLEVLPDLDSTASTIVKGKSEAEAFTVVGKVNKGQS